jgi:hypothetical protein
MVDRFEVFRGALASLGEAPGPLSALIAGRCSAYRLPGNLNSSDLLNDCEEGGPDCPLRLILHSCLARWDYSVNPDWAQGTPASTNVRRQLIYELLELGREDQDRCSALFPYAPAVDLPTVIVNGDGWQHWYTAERQAARSFYWSAYEEQLTLVRKWDGKNLAAIRSGTTRVVERFADPEANLAVSTKGLVVGYVQSGKTANFSGVIARAADAGYRLFIVLAGTQNTLRDQTQRRIDKELIGRELLGDEYEDSDDYHEFVTHGGIPSHQGSFDWERLTSATGDFRQLLTGLAALRFKRVHPELPFRHPKNLHAESARLIVVKKNDTSLRNLISALRQAETHVQWADVPSVVIDDESDQASVGTRPPDKGRTTINGQIVELLGILKAAQYVGYTATPFANVFIDADDPVDLFPSDYILSLPRPAGYMGVADFYGDEPPTDGDYRHPENAFIRSVRGDDELDTNLPQALDAFILSGAIKLYRQSVDLKEFKHHTMLVHQSPNKAPQKLQADVVRGLFDHANYGGSLEGRKRLERMWSTDYARVLRAQDGHYAMPHSFAELAPFVGQCYARVTQGESPVLILNGDHKEDTPDFDRTSVWKIIVGGAKLSRGYTVEGLTISYYRRRAQAADTLMQMGRWFGYREGYRDLVRLYIGRTEPLDKKGKRTIDLYEAFRATCRDEEEFREELKRYASLEGDERLTPKQVPPLVPSHMLRPTSKNKMYNAKVVYQNFGGAEVQKTVVPTAAKDREWNIELVRSMLSGIALKKSTLGATVEGKTVKVKALCCDIGPDRVITFLRKYRWGPGEEGKLQLVVEFLEGVRGDPGIDRWLFIAPQLVGGAPMGLWDAKFTIRERARNADDTRYLVFSEPEHVTLAKYLSGVSNGKAENQDTEGVNRPKQGVILFYPVLALDEVTAQRRPTMGFVLRLPVNEIPRKISYSVRDPANADSVVVGV